MSYKVQKPCKVCGKMYTPCGYCESDKSAFHWRTVACSYACGQEYLRRVMEARSKNKEKTENKEETTTSNKVVETKFNKKMSKRVEIKANKNKEESEQIG